MIEARIPIKIPPGLFMNGTRRGEQAGRWLDGNAVRFVGETGTPRPVGGWAILTGNTSPPAGTPRHAFAWLNENDGGHYITVAKDTSIYNIQFTSGTSLVTNITPSAGTGSPLTYSIDTLDAELLVTAAGRGPASTLWRWNSSSGGVLAPVSNYSTVHGATSAVGVVVTPNAFVVVLGIRDVRWASQGTYNTWAPSGTNSAGDLPVATDGRLLRGLVVGEETLIFGDRDVFELEYVGGDLIHGIRPVCQQCGLYGPNTVVAVGNRAFWMGDNKFYQYDGYVRELPCDIADQIFPNLSESFSIVPGDKAFAVHLPSFSEVWWFYMDTGDTTPGQAAIYNYENDTWSWIELERAAGTHGVLPDWQANDQLSPVMVNALGTAYLHEISSILFAPGPIFLESGDVPLGDANRVLRVQKIIPDGATDSDSVSLIHRMEPSSAETTTTKPVDIEGAPIDVRVTGRYFRYSQLLNEVSSRVGVPEIGVIQTGRR